MNEKPVSNKINIDFSKTSKNFSFAIANNFYCQIVDGKNDKTTFYLQDCNIPSVSLPTSEQANQTIGYNTQTNVSEITHSPLEMSLLLDEEFKSYAYFWNWKEDILLQPETFKDIFIYITTNMKNIKYRFQFTGCHLTDLSGFQLTSKMTDVTPMVFTVSFVYERMWLEILNQ